MARSIELLEVGPRDGLQNEPRRLPVLAKVELISRLVAAGLKRIEVASFVNPKRVPQMADAEELLAALPRVDGVSYVGLVLNRSKPWTNASQQALEMLKTWPYPVVAQLRDTQAYVVLVGLGRSLFDYHSAQVREHQADWEPLLKWLAEA